MGDIRPNPYQPRKRFDDKSLKELSDSIKENGVFQPIIVRESVNGYEIIAGERRFRASKLAKKKTIPAIIRKFNESQMMEVAVLENLQREDLTPLEEAQAYEMLQKNLGLTQEEVSKRMGKSRPFALVNSFFSFRLNSLRGIMTMCPQPIHFNLISAPMRKISQSLVWQAWGFFIWTVSAKL